MTRPVGLPSETDGEGSILLTVMIRAKHSELVLAYMGSLVRGCRGLYTYLATLV